MPSPTNAVAGERAVRNLVEKGRALLIER